MHLIDCFRLLPLIPPYVVVYCDRHCIILIPRGTHSRSRAIFVESQPCTAVAECKGRGEGSSIEDEDRCGQFCTLASKQSEMKNIGVALRLGEEAYMGFVRRFRLKGLSCVKHRANEIGH